MPKVTDALRNHHTAEWTKDNITSRNSGEKYNCNLKTGLTWQTLDHKPLLSEKENNCHTQKKIWHNQRQKRVIICGLPFHSAAHFSLHTQFILGQFTFQEEREVLRKKRSSSSVFYSTKIKVKFIHMCISVTLRLFHTALLSLTILFT